MCGNEEEKAGAAYTAGYAIIPTLSVSVKPKMEFSFFTLTYFCTVITFG
jgi:hypothetical protein